MTTFAAVFAYEVSAGGADAFEAVYGPDGDWARFFRGGDGYLGTELLRRDVEGEVRYLVIDRWASAASYERFLRAQEAEYGRRNRDAQSLWLQETAVGRFAVLPPDVSMARHDRPP